VAETHASADGTYELRNIRPGEYYLGINLAETPSDEMPYARFFYPGTDDHPLRCAAEKADMNPCHRWDKPWTALLAPLLLGGAVLLQAAGPVQRLRLHSASVLVQDQRTGELLFQKRTDEVLPIASLTKLMTAYIVFQELAAGKLKLNDQVMVSEHAWRSEGSRTFIELGKPVSVEDLILGMIVQSGNDATIALHHHRGNEVAFDHRTRTGNHALRPGDPVDAASLAAHQRNDRQRAAQHADRAESRSARAQ